MLELAQMQQLLLEVLEQLLSVLLFMVVDIILKEILLMSQIPQLLEVEVVDQSSRQELNL